jgi:hypothetical protein
MSTLEITTKIGCKNSCVYCPQDNLVKVYLKRSDILEMSLDIFKICIETVPTNVEIVFAGMCEPWLNPRCTDMILYAHEKKHSISVNTTLSGMSLRDIDRIASIPFNKFIIHLPSDGSYERIDVDKNYIEVFKKILKSNLKLLFVLHCGVVHRNLQPLMKEKFYPAGFITRAGNVKIMGIPFLLKKKGKIGCKVSLSENILLPNGDVILCCMDYGLKHILGNLLSDRYYSLFNSEEFNRIKKGFFDESIDILCRNCEQAINVSLFAKIYNPLVSFLHHQWWRDIRKLRFLKQDLKKILYRLKHVRDLKDVQRLISESKVYFKVVNSSRIIDK